MKFMKLGSKPDSFQSDGKNDRYVASELASDITITVGDVRFHLHKFPLLSKSVHLQKLVAAAGDEQADEVDVSDIPGGVDAFEVCAKFCYGMTVTLNAHNVVVARCAAEYLEMHEGVEKGNLVYKVDVFLGSSLFRSWKDSIIVLQTTTSLSSPLTEELKLAGRCVEAIAAKACVDVSKVDWSYTYNRKKLQDDVIVKRSVPGDWWVEDLCELEIELFKRVIAGVKAKERVSGEVIGEALRAYAYRKFPGFGKSAIVAPSSDEPNLRATVDSIVWLLPEEKGSVSCGFLLRLLKAASVVGSGEAVKEELVGRIGQQLEAASVSDILIRTAATEESDEEEAAMYDVGIVKRIVQEFLRQGKDQSEEIEALEEEGEGIRRIRPGILSDASKLMVAKLVDGYLAEIAKDPKLALSEFVELAEMVSGISRPAHDGIYRAIDMYLKAHPGISKGERKRICKLMDCRKLSVDACMHAVQNERLPLRVVVQVLFFEQVRAAASSGSSTPDLPKSIKDLGSASRGSSRSNNTNAEDDWDAVATAEELRALRGELAALRLSNASAGNGANGAAVSKMRGLLKSKKIFTRLWSGKASQAENSGSDSSGSLGSAVAEEAKSTPSRNRRHSVS